MDDDLAALRRQLGTDVDPYEDRVRSDFSALTGPQWHRAIIERARYERGELTDWPNVVPLTDEEKHVIGRMGDALIGLFRRIK